MDDIIFKGPCCWCFIKEVVIDLQEDPKNRPRPLMDPSSPDVKRPWRNLISTPGPNPIQLRSLYMIKDSACPLSSLMACTRSTGQEAGKINGHKTKRSITEREREREREREGEKDRERGREREGETRRREGERGR